MSNVKAVTITGKLPFDCAKHADLCGFLGHLNAPTFGLRVNWGTGHDEYRPNAWGGRTAFSAFTIAGEEAVGGDWVKALLQAIVDAGGEVSRASYRDIESGEPPVRPPVPAPRVGRFVVSAVLTVANPEKLDRAEPAWSLSEVTRDKLVVDVTGPTGAIAVAVEPKSLAIKAA